MKLGLISDMRWVKAKHIGIGSSHRNRFPDALILAQALADRRLNTAAQINGFLYPAKYIPASPFSFPAMDKVIDRIQKAITENHTIGIWGDFDVDGQTSTAILVHGLSRFGAKTVFHIPIRETESHGVNLTGFKQFIAKFNPRLVITCDTGISDIDAVTFANSQGIDMIITDHHTIPDKIPNAYAIVNPHQLPNAHPLSKLAGVGTAFQVIRAMAESKPNMVNPDAYLDLVALGTIADIAKLQQENRYYCQLGLEMMNRSLRPGLKEILNVSGAKVNNITENTIGFIFAPRLNAAGRLGDANPNVNFLLSEDSLLCEKTANELEILNETRKQAVENVLYSAHELIQAAPGIMNRAIFILSNPKWNAGVLGIAAGKLKDTFNRPVILMRESDGQLSGSARSVEGIDITHAIAKQAGLLLGFGGHAMAAGLRMPVDRIQEFIPRMEKTIADCLENDIQQTDLQIDHIINFSDINTQLIEELRILSPFGPGNLSPIFASKKLEIIGCQKIGKDNKHQVIKLRDENGEKNKVVRWNAPPENQKFNLVNIAYKIQLDEYQNQISLELVDMQEYLPEEKTVDTFTFEVNWHDYRNVKNANEMLMNLSKSIKNLQRWCEGSRTLKDNFDAKNRMQISKSESLAILCAPPDFSVLHTLLNKSGASNVYLFDLYQPNDKLKDILLAAGGRIKYHLRSQAGPIDLEDLSAQINQTFPTTHLILEWFESHGDISIIEDKGNVLVISSAKRPPNTNLDQIARNLNKFLKESAAFREYYKRVEPAFLFRKSQKISAGKSSIHV